MNRDQLAQRHTAAITRWWVTMRDTGKVHPELLTDLAGIADEHARQHALSIEEGHRGEHAPASREERAEAAAPPLVAANAEGATGGPGRSHAVLADGTIVGGGGGSDAPGPAAGGGGASGAVTSSGGSGAARTRARTRGAAK
jgi:hypothetical protein